LSASNLKVHRDRPLGGSEQASAVMRASKAPSKVRSHGLNRGLRVRATSSPSSTKRCLRCSMVRDVTPRASATSATFQGAPCSPASLKSKARAWRNFLAGIFPLRVIVSSFSRSSFVRVILYLGAMTQTWHDSSRLLIRNFMCYIILARHAMRYFCSVNLDFFQNIEDKI
jgi:hypothetical protein